MTSWKVGPAKNGKRPAFIKARSARFFSRRDLNSGRLAAPRQTCVQGTGDCATQVGAIQWLLGHAYTRLTESMRAVEHYQTAFTLDSNLPFVEFMENDIEFQLADVPGSDSCVMVLRELYEDIYGLKDLRLSRGDIVIDVGAHVGAVSIFLGKRFPDVRILAYEPCRDTFGVLQDNVRRNNVTNVESFNLAISGNGSGLPPRTIPLFKLDSMSRKGLIRSVPIERRPD